MTAGGEERRSRPTGADGLQPPAAALSAAATADTAAAPRCPGSSLTATGEEALLP